MVELGVGFEANPRLDSLGRRLRVATQRKVTQLTDLLYQKVLENLSGKILQEKSGELKSQVRRQLNLETDEMSGDVFIDPVSPKAQALEHGGKGYYLIEATKASVLHFFMKSGEERFAKSVMHPPSKAFAYLAIALEDVRAEVPNGFRDAIQAVMDGKDFE